MSGCSTPIAVQLGALLAMLAISAPLAGSARAAPREVRVRWQPSRDADVVGYRVYVGLRAGVHDMAVDVESFDLESGVAATTLSGIDDLVTYYLTVTAIDAAGQESALSNEIALPGAMCAVSACDDANSCTVDACASGVCGHAAVANGSVCDDLDPLTQNDTCFVRVCAGVAPPGPAPAPPPTDGGKNHGKKPRR